MLRMIRLLYRCRLPAACLAVVFGAAVSAQPTDIEVESVTSKPWVQLLPLTGSLTSPARAALAPRVAGLITAVAVDAGDRVSRGDTLLEMDDTLAELEVATLEASLAEARSRLAEARRVRDERKPLAERGTIPRTELESATAEVRTATAAVDRLEAEVALQRERLARHTLPAPFDGVVASRMTDIGEYAASSDVVFELIATDQLRLDVQAPQEYFGHLAPGTPVRVQAHDGGGESRSAEVSTRVDALDATARSFLVRVRLDNEDGRLAPGMSAEAEFRVESGEDVISMSRDAVLRSPNGDTHVWVVADGDDGPVARRRQITLGRSDRGRVEVRRGLSAGDRVVVQGNEGLRDGQRVRIESDS